MYENPVYTRGETMLFPYVFFIRGNCDKQQTVCSSSVYIIEGHWNTNTGYTIFPSENVSPIPYCDGPDPLYIIVHK